MKFIFAIVSLACLVLAQTAFSVPVYADGAAADTVSSNSVDARIGIPSVNCIIQCVQPTGVESEDTDAQTRGVLSNYGTLYDCIKQCGKN